MEYGEPAQRLPTRVDANRFWILAAGLALLQGALGVAAVLRARQQHTVYVLTPLVDVVPGGAPLGAVEAAQLTQGLRHTPEARDMQLAYARLGSTLSLDDLLRGVEALDAAGVPLQGSQAGAVRGVLSRAKQDHADIIKVQADILDTEAKVGAKVDAIVARLPPETRARVGK